MSYFLTRRVAQAENGLDDVKSSINTTNAVVSVINGNITSLNAGAALLTNKINATDGNVSAINGNITSLNAGATLLTNKISATDGNVSSIQTSITTLTTSITNINNNYAVKSLTAGTNVSLTNASGNWTINASTSANYSGVYNASGSTTVARITFDNIGVNLTTHRIKGVIQIGANGSFDYPLIIFNGQNLTAGVNTNSSASQIDEFSQISSTIHNGTYAAGNYNAVGYQDYSQMFCDRSIPDGNGAWILNFTIDLQRKQDGNENGYMMCFGDYSYTQKPIGGWPTYWILPHYSYYGKFIRGTDITSISSIGIQGFYTNNTIRYSTINLNIEPLPSYTTTGTTI